ncbi:hypothetical protein Y032_0251g185 [Ancylostoma ceylanicum]|uniref:Uncharacterized protein n=1 Tax=Ancylostoma ceylanicum TaxID=53326 RepID=A0A016SCU3_9BILA|nr:hypothetical protein Y032_0251g185 [Ancylostoma ceylanicum]
MHTDTILQKPKHCPNFYNDGIDRLEKSLRFLPLPRHSSCGRLPSKTPSSPPPTTSQPPLPSHMPKHSYHSQTLYNYNPVLSTATTSKTLVLESHKFNKPFNINSFICAHKQ